MADENETAPRKQTRRLCGEMRPGMSRPCRSAALPFFNKCLAHGGRHVCNEKGCKEKTDGARHFCPQHYVECVVEGCPNLRQYQNGGCYHHPQGDDNGTDAAHHEWVKRLKRDRKTRARWLDTLLAEQGGRCANSVVTCKVVNNGQATSICQWGQHPLPPEAAQVDHKKPLWAGGSDAKENLQALCACCHAIKSFAEARQRAGRAPRPALFMGAP